jgi:hypothetical protein
VTSEKFKDQKKRVTIESYFCLFLEVMSIFEVHRNMSAESAIEKLQNIAKEKEA